MNNYQKSIDKVLSYIDNNLDEKQDLDKLAELTFISKFHFHRIMSAYLNEPLGTYINRIRLETATKLLRYSNQAITEIASNVGYETQSAFNKGFKKQFNVNPKTFKENKTTIIELQKSTTNQTFQLVESVKKIERLNVIFQQSKGKIGDQITQDNWDSLFTNAVKQNLVNASSKFIGINWDDPEITQEEKVRYDACISVSNNESSSVTFSTKTIVGGRYLCFLYKGDYQNLGAVYNQIFRDWIFKKEYELREEAIFEQYINNKEITAKEDLLTEIFIPIK